MIQPRLLTFALLGVAAFLPLLPARGQFLPQRYSLTDLERAEITSGRERLQDALDALREQSRKTGKPTADQIPDVEIYYQAVDRNLRQNLFFTKKSVEHARYCIDEGESRARALQEGRAPWEQKTGLVARGFRSKVDGSAQPYLIWVPAKYAFDRPQKGRLDVQLHGRAGVMNEIAFLANAGPGAKHEDLPFLVLQPYGRSNNGYHFAGETDVFEALASVRERFAVDGDRIIIRGFSMGGHGTWHLGLQHPGMWAAMAPGAGFVETRRYQKITEPFPSWEMSLLHVYDAVDYAANGVNLPVSAYVGDQDPAIGQHQLMVEALKREQVPFKEFIGPNTQHRYHPESLRQIMKDLETPVRRWDADRVDFMTYTLRFPQCKWVRIEGLQRHWDRAEVHAQKHAGSPERIEVTTRNISSLRLTMPGTLLSRPVTLGGKAPVVLTVDGEKIAGATLTPDRPFYVHRYNGRWRVGEPKGLRKKPGLQGPIDDALYSPLVAVTPTGTPWSAPMHRWLEQEVQRFRDGWDQYFRATLPERTDRTLSGGDLREKNLYLFGDPGSNAVLRRLLPKLPIRWTKETITLAGRTFSTKEHLPMLVFPNPESPDRYVVINSGFTFSRADWDGSNSLQYPHLPDWAVIQFDPEKFADSRRLDTRHAGFFDERWQVTR